MALDPLRSVVWHPTERRPRAPVRLALTAVVAIVVLGLTTVVLVLPLLLINDEVSVFQFLGSLVFRASLVVAIILAAVFVDCRQVSDLGLQIDREWWIDLCFGLVLGAVLMAGVFVVALVAGWIRITGYYVTGSLPWGFVPGFAALAAQYVLVGVSEEIVVRGYLLTNLAEAFDGYVSRQSSVLAAVLLSSGLFGVAHATNPNATVVSTLALSLLGILFAVGYVLTGRIAIPIGLHTTWNLFQGGVFGFAVSGGHSGVSIVGIANTGTPVMTGGAFGPEAGLLGVCAITLGIACIAGYVRRGSGQISLSSRVTTPALRWTGCGQN